MKGMNLIIFALILWRFAHFGPHLNGVELHLKPLGRHHQDRQQVDRETLQDTDAILFGQIIRP